MTDSAYSARTPADATADYRREVAARGDASVAVLREMEHHFPAVHTAYLTWCELFGRDQRAHIAAQPDDFDAMDIFSGGEPFGPRHWSEETTAAWRTYQAALVEAASKLLR